jgi:phosphoribosylformylglycinamidine synthase
VKEPTDLKEVATFLTKHLNIASKRFVTEQYDSMVGTGNMSTNKPSDAGVIHVKGTDKAIAMTVDCNSRYVHADPEIGTAIAVTEAARNIVCSGGKPLAITNCLNFGNPYKPEVYWQFVGAIKGMGKACTALGTPVTGGNVSFYNQTVVGEESIPVFPTPTIGMIGLIENLTNHTGIAFQNVADKIYLIGAQQNDISCSEYLYSFHQVKLSPAPYFNLEEEMQIHEAVAGLIANNIIQSAHDVADGGLWITLLESAMQSNKGFRVELEEEIRLDAQLFGEAQGRIVVSVSPEKEPELIEWLAMKDVLFTSLGEVTSHQISINGVSFGETKSFKDVFDTALGNVMHA